MVEHRRRDTRYSIRFPVQLWHAKRADSLVSEDVSQGGVFLCTDSPPPLLQLVQVQLVLPIGGRALKAHGMTVHVVEPENAQGRVAGIGVQFYALDRATREAWEAFVRHVEANFPRAADQEPLRLPRGQTPEPLSRRFGRHTAVLEIKPANLDELEELYTRDVATGSMFVPTRLEVPAGAQVVLNVTHPTSGSPFLLEAKVVHRTGLPAGLGVELIGVDRKFREEFLDFVRGGIIIDDEVVIEDAPPPSSQTEQLKDE
jgi:Tfp pilus assembly protein PilZ